MVVWAYVRMTSFGRERGRESSSESPGHLANVIVRVWRGVSCD